MKKISHVLLFLTYRCNLRCDFCLSFNGYWRAEPSVPLPAAVDPMVFLRPNKGFREISTADIVDRIIPECEKNGVEVLALSGGEPLLRRDAPEVFRSLGGSGLRWCLDSNLMLCDRAIADTVIEANCSTVFVSFDGTRDIHNLLRGNPAAFEGASRGLAHFIDSRRMRKDPQTSITINCVLQPGNESVPPDMVRFAIDRGADELSFQLLSKRNYTTDFDARTAARALELAMAMADRTSLRASVYPLSSPNEGNLSAWYSMPLTNRFYKGCTYIHNNLRIDPEGNVIPCLEHKVGNILETDLSDILAGRPYRKFLQRHAQAGPFPACLRCCNARISCHEI